MELPNSERIRLIQNIQRVMSKPQIVEGQISPSGKTILVERENQSNHRLDTEAILQGETVFRDPKKYQLYTPERMRSAENTNKAEGPVPGVNEVTDFDELPADTHKIRR